jgi:hypothetical protein
MAKLDGRRWLNSRSIVMIVFFALVAAWSVHLVRERVLAWRLRRFDADVVFIHGEVTHISFRDSAHTFGVRGTPSPFGDQDLALLKAFPRIGGLSLEDTSVTNAGLGQILQLPSLNKLDVCVEQITPEREREFRDAAPHITISKMHFVDGFRVSDGYQ